MLCAANLSPGKTSVALAYCLSEDHVGIARLRSCCLIRLLSCAESSKNSTCFTKVHSYLPHISPIVCTRCLGACCWVCLFWFCVLFMRS